MSYRPKNLYRPKPLENIVSTGTRPGTTNPRGGAHPLVIQYKDDRAQPTLSNLKKWKSDRPMKAPPRNQIEKSIKDQVTVQAAMRKVAKEGGSILRYH